VTYHHVVPLLEDPLEDWHVFIPSMRHVHWQLDHAPSVGYDMGGYEKEALKIYFNSYFA